MDPTAAVPHGTTGIQAGAARRDTSVQAGQAGGCHAPARQACWRRTGHSPAAACPGLNCQEEGWQREPDEPAQAARHTLEFLATLAHELRHPLAPLGHGLALLRLQRSDPAAASQTLDMMERQLGQLARLVDGLLDTARITSGKVALRKERVALGSVLASALETSVPLIESMRHDLVVDVPEDGLVLEADPARLVQVLVNLLGNAAKYTPSGGRITVSARREGLEAVITVADNGQGIAAAALASVFELFSQAEQHIDRAQGGLGIGLALVRQLVELHGGTASAASPGPGQGSVFTVRLPLAGAGMQEALTAPALLQPPEMTAAPARGLRVLLVDDHAESARALAAVLELKGHGHVVAVAGTGGQAVQLARHFKPEVAFLDLSMPGMDGYELAQALRQLEGLDKLRLVALTGWGDKRSRARSAAAGFDHHLTKPVPLGAIDALLCALVSAAREPEVPGPGNRD